MEKTSEYILFVVIVSGIAVAFLLFIVVDIVLLYRIKQVKNKNRIIEMETRFVKEMNEAKVEAAQEVMNEISRELHDNIGQSLTLSLLQLNQIQAADNNMVQQTAELLRQTTRELRQLSHQLSGDLMEKLDMRASVERIRENIIKTGSIQADFHTDKLPESFGKPSELLLLRIMQELINNSLKHSGADTLRLQLTNNNTNIALQYTDNGKGFEMGKSESSGLGMTSIRKRFDMLNAQVEVLSTPGNGFQLNAQIPIKA